jgi:hypothetical protein
MTYPESFDHYQAAWNEPDATQVRGHLERSLADGALFIDPANQVTGIDAIEAMIKEAHAAMDAQYVRVSGIDGHNRRYRYRWEVRQQGKPAIPGMDVTTLNEAGRIERIDGFFGDFPPHE